jgi:hypothetical protein
LLRHFVLLFLLFSSLFSQGLFTPYSALLQNISGNTALIPDSDDIVIGSSGVVVHKFDEHKSTIIARANVIEKSNGNAKIRFEVFDLLEQSAFPLPGVMPENGDTVMLNYLYDRALIVSPNQTVYSEITKHFSDIAWVHPDIVGAYLATNYKPNPDREDFRQMCRENSAGIIFFALNFNGYVADCQSFKVLKTFESGRISQYQVPFYTRVRGIESAFWKWESAQISDYNRHYERLLVK